MSIERKSLFRGNKLSAQRINEVHSGVASEIAAGVGPSAQPGQGKFAIDWNLPSIESYMFDGLVGNDLNYSKLTIPFAVPPPQGLATTTGLVDENTPNATMRRVSVGFDQVMTGRAFTDMWSQFGACLDYDLQKGGYGFSLELWEKTPAKISSEGLNGTAPDNSPDNLIWQQDIGASLFDGDNAFNNPVDIFDLRVTIQPYRTYIWYIRFTGLLDAVAAVGGATLALGASGFHLRAEFEYPLVPRDTELDFTQNMPSLRNGQRQAATISLDTATTDSTITASAGLPGQGRIQTNLETIDKRLVNKLKAGYDRNGRLPVQEELVDDQSLCVIAVPMFGQIGDIRAVDINTIGLPYGSEGDFNDSAWDGILADRRLIRIQHPFTLHRVLVVSNYYSPPTVKGTKPNRGGLASGLIPASPTFTNKIGVNIASGIDGADDRRYQTAAYLEYTPVTKDNYCIDRIKEGGTPPRFGLGTDGAYDHEMLDVPLVWFNTYGTGMYGLDSGPPFYMGRAENDTEVRSQAGVLPFPFGGGAPTTPITNGREQFIEVRWTMEDSAGLSPNNPNVDTDTCYVGNGGCWVYLIGKKSPVKAGG